MQVEVRVVEDHRVRRGQVDPKPARARREKEDVCGAGGGGGAAAARRRLEARDERVALGDGRRAVEPQEGEPSGLRGRITLHCIALHAH